MPGSFLFLLLFTAGQLAAQQVEYQNLVNGYIKKYKDIAMKEMFVYRIPASITLAQGILESNVGRSPLATQANNHFGIKCHKGWLGNSFYQDDDLPNECFRKYDNPIESYRDHSYFLTQRDRYKELFELDVNDYKGWANGLQSAGYATSPTYAIRLIQTIETYSLYMFDNSNFMTAFGDTLTDLDNPSKQAWLRQFIVIKSGPNNRNVFENNRLQMTIARKDDNIYLLARDFDISVNSLLDYNDLPRATALRPGQIVYLESKRRKAAAESHLVQRGETLYTISQLYGIKLKMLYKRNDLLEGVEPSAGMVLKLR